MRSHAKKDKQQSPGRHIPLSVVFALGCVLVLVAFTAVTTLSAVMFSKTTKESVDANIQLALTSAMEHVMKPLDESSRYIDRLRDKIEMDPATYGIDDVDPHSISGNPTLKAFYLDTMLASLQRLEMTYIFQTRQSSRYEHSPGVPVDMNMVASGVDNQLLFMANNSWVQIDITSKDNLTKINTMPITTMEVNLAGAPFINDAYNTVNKRWIAAAFSIPQAGVATSTLMTIYAKIRGFPGGSWALGIDHNMAEFRELMAQATPPFSLGIIDANKVVVEGSHTSLYDLHGNSFITSSLQGVNLFKSDSELWPAGGTPSADLNQVYTKAIEVCKTSDCNSPVIHRDGSRLISILRVRDASTDLDLLMVSSVPRSYFFGSADTSMYVSITVSAVCCVLMIVGCVGLLMCIRPALSKLQDNMLLASELQNDRVEHTDSVLTDIAELSSVFDEMNKRLLVARSFVPEAVLLGQQDNTQDDDDEGSVAIRGRTGSKRTIGSQLSNSMLARSSIVRSGTIQTSQDTPTSVMSSEKLARLFVMGEKRVTVLALNLLGFNNLLTIDKHIPRAQRIHEISAQLLTIVVAAAQEERGVMDSFHGDHFILTFNASRAVAGALGAAVRTAGAISVAVRHDSMFRGSLGLSAGAASGKTHVGTLGIDGHRRLSVVGHAYRSAVGLQGVCAQFMQRTATRKSGGVTAGCVVDEQALKEISSSGIYMQLIGCATNAAGRDDPTNVYAAHCLANGCEQVDDDEWLYELDAIQAGDPFRESNEAMAALMSGDIDRCGQLIASHKQERGPTRNQSVTDSVTSFDNSEVLYTDNPAWTAVDIYHHHTQEEVGKGRDPWVYSRC